VTGFQYLKGAIGSRATDHTPYPAMKFQYLKGAIGSFFGSGSAVENNRFQYLKGAIGRTERARPPIKSCKISIPQRCDWKPGKDGPQARAGANFNTSKVRLEVDDVGDLTIEEQNFNTSKVRLEVERLQEIDGDDADFNTSKVRLEASASSSASSAVSYFNTSKVRLEVRAPQRLPHGSFRISIPQRCDWKLRRCGWSACRKLNFNTSKVRLEGAM